MILAVFVGIAIFFSFMAWVTAAPLRGLRERVDVIVKNVDATFERHNKRLTALEAAKSGEVKPEGYRENANQSAASEDKPDDTDEPNKPFVYGQDVDVLLGDDGFDNVDHPRRPMFTAAFYGFSKIGSTTMVHLKVGDRDIEAFVLADIDMFHPEAP